jgi:hypothetical protein
MDVITSYSGNYPGRALQEIRRMAAIPADRETIRLFSGREVDVTKWCPSFEKWTGSPIKKTLRKPVIKFEGRPLFAELATLRLLQKQGWDGVWVSPFHRGKCYSDLPERMPPRVLPEARRQMLDRVEVRADMFARAYERRRAPNRWSGCWDVYAWRGTELRFLELKRARSGDRVRANQKLWLEAAIREGVALDAFVFVEWDWQAV